MPFYSELRLAPLERGETREQVGSLLRASPRETLVEEVYARTGGDAYLNRRLVEDLPPDTRHLGGHLPPDLRAAVLRPSLWLSDELREFVQWGWCTGAGWRRTADRPDLRDARVRTARVGSALLQYVLVRATAAGEPTVVLNTQSDVPWNRGPPSPVGTLPPGDPSLVAVI